ncbi:MAG: tRNA 2-thiouridine(34) synthase MnmA [Myxococcales bacterium]|nr:tRNA 2-thiouridine(34) synthase MnmA [Myxococcales bacterium]
MTAPASTAASRIGRPEAGARVLVAMSGGVDSSLAAALLHEAGYEVVGVTLHLWDAEGKQQVGRCCAPEDRRDARITCDFLGVPHYVIDEREAFRGHVVDPFVRDNAAGLTPSPCVACNQHVKLGRLVELADRFGASHVGTGHYARLEHAPAEGPPALRLRRGDDHAKDQSYFLFGVEPAVLARLVFPLGEMNKGEGRERARQLGLPNWDKPDSQELCFVPDGDVAGFVRERRQEAGRAGAVVDEDGRELGRHGGIEGFTVGQRRGIGVGGGERRYVLRVVPDTAEVVVGPDTALLEDSLEATGARWLQPLPPAGRRAQVRIRYRHTPAPAFVTPTDAGFRVVFEEPQRAVAPGQAAVVYDGDEVLGGGYIT